MMIDVLLLGNRLQHLRELKGLSLSALSEIAGISKSYLAKLERGEVENPGLQTLQSIAGALDTTLGDLLAGPGEQPDRSRVSEIGEFELLLDSLPPGLRDFIEQRSRRGDRLPADVVRSLARIQFRGKRPETAEDWEFICSAIERSMR